MGLKNANEMWLVFELVEIPSLQNLLSIDGKLDFKGYLEYDYKKVAIISLSLTRMIFNIRGLEHNHTFF